MSNLRQGGQETLKVSGEFAESGSLPLGIALCAHLNESGHTRLQPAHVPLLKFSVVPQTL